MELEYGVDINRSMVKIWYISRETWRFVVNQVVLLAMRNEGNAVMVSNACVTYCVPFA